MVGLLLATLVGGFEPGQFGADHPLALDDPPASAGVTVQVRVSNPGPGGTDQVLEAVRWMTEAGYELPEELQIRLRSQDCGHALAVYRNGEVRVCRDWGGLQLQYLIIHELAHAWADARLDVVDRRVITAALGLPSWRDPSDSWTQRASEVIAEAVVAHVAPFPYISRHPQLHTELFDRAIVSLAPYRQSAMASTSDGFSDLKPHERDVSPSHWSRPAFSCVEPTAETVLNPGHGGLRGPV